MHPKVLSIVGVGCGGRTRIYCELAANQPHRYRVVAAADPNPIRVEQVRQSSRNPDFRCFSSDKELFAAGKLADICIIGTQDAYHVEPAIGAMELGYDVLLEKPIACDPREVLALNAHAERLGRKVLVCHVLRYTPYYTKIKSIIESGVLGEIITIDAREGVDPWHQSHSFVRGQWGVSGKSTPMIVAKCCHDMDMLSWLIGRPCERVSSFGMLTHFNKANAPAGAPARCTDGCPVDTACPYNALLYMSQHRQQWLPLAMDNSTTATPEEIRKWLAASPWGRCAYQCDNDVVDHQVIAMEFQGALTATFTMTAFDTGRDMIICGTKGKLRGGDNLKKLTGHDIVVETIAGDSITHNVPSLVGGYESHGGGDAGLVFAMDEEFAKPASEMRSGLPASVESHIIAYAAEKSRVTGKTVELTEFVKELK